MMLFRAPELPILRELQTLRTHGIPRGLVLRLASPRTCHDKARVVKVSVTWETPHVTRKLLRCVLPRILHLAPPTPARILGDPVGQVHDVVLVAFGLPQSIFDRPIQVTQRTTSSDNVSGSVSSLLSESPRFP